MTYVALAMPATYFIPDVYQGLVRLMPRYSNRKVGGIRFIKLGRINFSVSISRK